MQKVETKIPDVFLIIPKVYEDKRGYFMETYSEKSFHEIGLDNLFVQDNQSFTISKGTLRGIHFQMDPMGQCKIVRVTKGAVRDLAIDLRRGSPTFMQWVMVELSAENKHMLYIPSGFGHGYVTITDNVEFVYKVDNLYSKECDRSIRFDDPELNVDWQVQNPILSEKDLEAPWFKNSDCNFSYKKIGM